jgi:hypothetical protein
LCEIIGHIGDRLSEFFPGVRDDENELSNEVSFDDLDDEDDNEDHNGDME